MKKLIILILIFNWSGEIFAQNDSIPKPDLSFEVGTMVGTNLKGGFMYENYIMPTLEFPITKKMNLDFSSLFSRTDFKNYKLYNSSGMHIATSGLLDYWQLDLSLSYMLTPKTYVGSTLYYQHVFRAPIPTNEPWNMHGMSFFVGHKFSKFSVRAAFSFNKYSSDKMKYWTMPHSTNRRP